MATPPNLGEVAPGEGPLDELLATLMQGGEVDSHGSFTMDRQKARQKMQRFQLAQPARYVLELVQAAVLRGARNITVQIEDNDLHLRCDATPFTLHDYEQVYDALFIRSRADKRQALRHLALGASTALSLNPAWVRIEGGGSTGAYLQLYPGDKERMGTSAQSEVGIHVHVRQRGRRGGLWRVLGHYDEPRPSEFELLREHCGLSMVPIEINGLPIALGYQLPNTMHWLNYQHGSTRGVIGVLTNFGIGLPPGYPFSLPSTMHLMRNCVSFELDRPPLLLPGFGTLVESPSFHLDISHQRVVRNDSYDEAVRLVLAQQLQLLVRECQRLHAGQRGLASEVLEGLMLALLSRLGSVDPILRWAGRSDAGPTLMPRGFPEQVAGAKALLSALLWPTLRSGLVSLAMIFDDLQLFGTLAVTTAKEPGDELTRSLVLYLKDATTQEVFENVFRGHLEDRSIATEATRTRIANLERWRKNKQEPRLPQGSYLAAVRVDTARVQGEIGITATDDDDASQRPAELRLTLLHKGGVLVVKALAMPFPGLCAVLAGDFLPTYAWDDVEPDEQLAAALRILLAALPALVEQLLVAPGYLVTPERRHALRELLIRARSASGQAQLFQPLGLAAPTALPELPPLGPRAAELLEQSPATADSADQSAQADEVPLPLKLPEVAAPTRAAFLPASSVSPVPDGTAAPIVADSAPALNPPAATPTDAPASHGLSALHFFTERTAPLDSERLHKLLADELRTVARSMPKLLGRINLGSIRITAEKDKQAVRCTEDEILVNREHAAMARALREAHTDPTVLWFIGSAIFTALKISARVTAAEELQLLALLNRRVMSQLTPAGPPR